MLSTNSYKTYKRVDIETASQGRLIVMLYEGAIRRVEEAIKQLSNQRMVKSQPDGSGPGGYRRGAAGFVSAAESLCPGQVGSAEYRLDAHDTP